MSLTEQPSSSLDNDGAGNRREKPWLFPSVGSVNILLIDFLAIRIVADELAT